MLWFKKCNSFSQEKNYPLCMSYTVILKRSVEGESNNCIVLGAVLQTSKIVNNNNNNILYLELRTISP